MLTLIKIRLIQIKHEAKDTGTYLVLVIGTICFLVFTSYKIYLQTSYAYYLTGILLLICLSIQLNRKDKRFVYNHVKNPFLEIYAEYIAVVFPFLVTSLFTKNWLCFPILIISLLPLPLIKIYFIQKTYFKNLSILLPSTIFEWISGFRKSFTLIIPLYILAISISWFRILPLFLLWLITISIQSFYYECESIQILRERNYSSKQLINRKLISHSKYLLFFYTPILVVNTSFHNDQWFVNLLFILIQITLLCLAICIKYSNYKPAQSSFSNNIVISIISISSIIPYLLPIPLLMTIKYYQKAKCNLKTYLHA